MQTRRVERIDLHYEYPPFTGLRPRDEQNGGDIYAPAGTKVRLRVQTDKPIAEIAARCGFESPSAFAKSFRSAMGESPRLYRMRSTAN